MCVCVCVPWLLFVFLLFVFKTDLLKPKLAPHFNEAEISLLLNGMKEGVCVCLWCVCVCVCV